MTWLIEADRGVTLMKKSHVDRFLNQPNTWNQWRQTRWGRYPDLSGAELNSLATKSTLDSNKSIFRHFQIGSFQGFDFHDANLRLAKVWTANLTNANFRGADLSGAEFRRSLLNGADLRGADLRNTQFLVSDLRDAQLDGALMGGTHFGFTKLGAARGLAQARHEASSQIDQFSIISSMPLPESFLHACNVESHTIRMAEWYIQERPYQTCFISYSRRDEVFVAYLREMLTWAGVPSWFAPHDMRREEFQSDKRELERDLFSYVDEAERVLLVISPNILPSRWVGQEVQRAGRSTSSRDATVLRIIPLLIETMPTPDSAQWNDSISRTAHDDKYKQFSSEGYSAALQGFLSTQFLDFRNWRDPSVFSQRVPWLLAALRRTT